MHKNIVPGAKLVYLNIFLAWSALGPVCLVCFGSCLPGLLWVLSAWSALGPVCLVCFGSCLPGLLWVLSAWSALGPVFLARLHEVQKSYCSHPGRTHSHSRYRYRYCYRYPSRSRHTLLKFSRSLYLDNQLSESIHTWTIGTQ